jgi:hypothetical protein
LLRESHFVLFGLPVVTLASRPREIPALIEVDEQPAIPSRPSPSAHGSGRESLRRVIVKFSTTLVRSEVTTNRGTMSRTTVADGEMNVSSIPHPVAVAE